MSAFDAESGLVHTAGVTTVKVHDAKADRITKHQRETIVRAKN